MMLGQFYNYMLVKSCFSGFKHNFNKKLISRTAIFHFYLSLRSNKIKFHLLKQLNMEKILFVLWKLIIGDYNF